MTMAVIFPVCLIILCFRMTSTQDVTTAVPSDDQYEESPIQRSMNPVYTMTNFFLETVLDPPDLAELHEKVNLTSTEAVVDSLSNWQLWVKHFSSYVACMVVGVVYAIAVPIIGCCLCGCRSRGKCGGGHRPMDSKNIKHKRRGFSVVLILFSIALLFGVTCLFISNALVYEQTQSRGLPDTLHSTVTRLNTFMNVAADSIKITIQDVIEVNLRDLIYSIGDIAGLGQQEVGTQTNIGPLLDAIQAYTIQLNATYTALQNMDATVSQIQTTAADLEQEVTILKNNLTNDFANQCVGCDAIINLANNLQVNVNFSGLPDMSQIVPDLENAMTGSDNIYEGLRLAQQEFDNKVRQEFENVTADTVQSLVDEANTIQAEVNNFLNEATSFLDTISFEKTLNYVNETVNPVIENVGLYRYYGGIATGSLVLLITVLCCFGVLIGVCGTRKGQPTQCCNKGTAHKILWTAIIFNFVFAWLLMLVTAVLLPIGGIPHNDVCVHLLVKDRLQIGDVIDEVVTSYLDLPFSFVDVFTRCGRDEALYTAFQLAERDPNLNLSTLLSPDRYNFQQELDSLKSKSYDPGNITLKNEPLVAGIKDIMLVTNEIDLNPYQMQLNMSILTVNLGELVTQLETIASNGDSNAKTLANNYISVINDIQNTAYTTVEGFVNQLQEEVGTVTSLLNDHNMTEVLSQLGLAQDLVTSDTLSVAIAAVADGLYQSLLDLLSNAELSLATQTATCGSVSHAADDVIHSACVRFMYPFNAYWFSLGWCLFFFILVIPFGVVVGDTYKKTQKYEPDAASFEEPSLVGLDDGVRNHGDSHDPYRLPRVATPSNMSATERDVPYDRFRNGRGADTTWDNPAYAQDEIQFSYIDGYRGNQLPRAQVSPSSRTQQQDFRW